MLFLYHNIKRYLETNCFSHSRLIELITTNFILIPLFLLSCATKYSPDKGTVKKIDDFYLHVVQSDDPVTDLILKTESYYSQNNLKIVKKFVEGFKGNNLLQKIYVSNLTADILTYHEVDIEGAFNINNFVFDFLRELSGNERLAYSKTYEKCRYPKGAHRGMMTAVTPIIGFVELVTAPFEKTADGATKRAIDDAMGKPRCKKINKLERGDLRNKFFDISIQEIRKMCIIRLVYLNELIGDFDEAESWRQRLQQK